MASGISKLGSAIFGSDGQSAPVATPTNSANTSLTNLQNFTNAKSSPQIQKILNAASTGNMSMQDALKAFASMGGVQGSSKLIPNTNQGFQVANSSMPAKPSTPKPVRGQFEDFGAYTARNADWLNQQKLAAAKAAAPAPAMGNDMNASAGLSALATDPILGNQLAAQMVQNNPLYQGYFGRDGLQGKAQSQYDLSSSNLATDREALMGRDQSFGLQNTDLAAYGQASDNIARRSAQSEQSLAQMLASRGLGSSNAPAAQMYSGVLGNQNEQLAQAQQQIAQQRITTAQGLAQSRANLSLQQQAQAQALAQGLGQLGLNAQNQQYNSQLQGSENQYNQMAGAAGMGMSQQGLNQNINNSQFAQQQSTAQPGFLGNLGQGFASQGTAIGADIGGAPAQDVKNNATAKVGKSAGSIFGIMG